MSRGRTQFWSQDDIVLALQVWAAAAGRPPKAKDTVGDRTLPSHETCSRAFGSWSSALQAAGLPCRRRWTPESAVGAIQWWAHRHGGLQPKSEQALQDPSLPTPTTVTKLFGSWAAGVEAAGFERPRTGPRPQTKTRSLVDEVAEQYGIAHIRDENGVSGAEWLRRTLAKLSDEDLELIRELPLPECEAEAA